MAKAKVKEISDSIQHANRFLRSLPSHRHLAPLRECTGNGCYTLLSSRGKSHKCSSCVKKKERS